MDIKEWESKGQYLDFKGNDIFYVEEGKGEVIIAIHGFPTSSWDWHKVWPSLTSQYRVLAPDLLGYGYSDKPKIKYKMAMQADLIEHILMEKGIKACHILAHDYGDTVVQELLARYRSRPDQTFTIKSVCLLNGGIFPESNTPRPIQKLLASSFGPIIGKFINFKRFSKSFSEIFAKDKKPGDEELEQFWSLITYKEGNKISHRVIQYLKERWEFHQRWSEALTKSTVPQMLIIGPEDPVSGQSIADRYKEIVPNPNVVILDGVGHYPQVEDPEGTLSNYLKFIGELSD
ncbi:MAG: alpha/beta hydrolase [Bacteroidota bacterium]